MRRTRTAKDGKGKDEHQHLGAAIHSRRSNVVVLDEVLRVLAADPELGDETNDEVGEAGGVDTDEEPAHVPEDDGEVDVGEDAVAGVAVKDPEWDGDDEAKEVGDGDPLVTS